MKRENAGQIRILEAFLSALVIFSAFAVSSNIPVSQNILRSSDLTSIGLQALTKLDFDGSLGQFIDDGNWTGLREVLNVVLPEGTSFNLTVYTEQIVQLNSVPISNGEFGSQTVACTEYICVSQDSAFHTYVIRLYLAMAA
jgi:hypothetical protein